MNDYQEVYQNLDKPLYYPPPWIFGVVWPVLYFIIAMTFGNVFYRSFINKTIPIPITIPFIINLMANFSFTYFQFILSNELLALIDILVVLISILISIVLVWPYSRIIASLQLPYLLWVIFATYLQTGIYFLNR